VPSLLRDVGDDLPHQGSSPETHASDARSASIDLARETGVTYDTAIDERGEFFRAIGRRGDADDDLRSARRRDRRRVGRPLNAEALKELVADHFGILA
jgi:hypothetical protein